MARKVLVIGWDAADWKVIHALTEHGKMPHLAALVEVLSSQKVMLANLGRDQARLTDEQLEQAFRRQLKQVGIWVARQPNIKTLFVSHREAIQGPLAVAEQVCAFLGGGLDVQAMAGVVGGSLYRRRAET